MGAFDIVKSQLASSKVLVHYDSDIDLVLSCDASPYGVGTALPDRFGAESKQPLCMLYTLWLMQKRGILI